MKKELLGMLFDEPTEDEIRAKCREKKEALGFDIEKALFPHDPLKDAPLREMSLDEAREKLKGWASVRDSVRASVLNSVRSSEFNSVLSFVFNSVFGFGWAYLSSIFFNIKKWEGIDHEEGANPFQSAVDLWECGYVPSFDGKDWRLNTKDGIVCEGEIC